MPNHAPRSSATSPEADTNFIPATVPFLRMANSIVTLPFFIIGAYGIKERALLGLEDLRDGPVRQERESREHTDKIEQAPTGAQATRVKEDFLIP